jgi:thioredoxin 1
MRRLHLPFGPLLVLVAALLPASMARCANTWKLVLKNGQTVECDGPPVIVNGMYLFRGANGGNADLPVDRVDPLKTALANNVETRSQWRQIGQSAPPRPRAAAPVTTESAGVLTLGDSSFDAEVLDSEVPVLVDFWATWCGPCLRLAPTVDAIAGEYAGRIKVGRLDVDQNERTADRYRVDALPTLLLFKNGRVVGHSTCAVGKAQIEQMLSTSL